MRKKHDNIRLYHVDHLGSTSLVTDIDGEITQHVAYIPYGEVFVEQRNGSWNTPYLFNAKELDEETGLYYYGARYLDPTAVRWLSVDPVFHAGSSPYAYCLGNPIKLIDIGGMDEYVFNEDGSFSHKKEKEGKHYGFVSGKNIFFRFADPENDPKLVESKEFTGLHFVSDTEIDNALWNSGVQDLHIAEWYLLVESNSKINNGQAKMDYVSTANFDRGEKQLCGTDAMIEYQAGIVSSTTLYLTYSKSAGYVAHNSYNFGNFLWGAGACELGCSLAEAVYGAHLNNYVFDHPGELDSADDQFSIKCGYKWVRDHGWFSKIDNYFDDLDFKLGSKAAKITLPKAGKYIKKACEFFK